MAAIAFAVASLGPVGGSAADDATLTHVIRLPHVTSDRARHPLEAPLEKAEQQWEDAGIDSYRISVSISCFGPAERHTVTVIDGDLTEIRSECSLGPDPFPCGEVIAERFTVPGIFAEIRGHLSRVPIREGGPDIPLQIGDWFVDAGFAPGLGLPHVMSWGLHMVADSGEYWGVTAFRALDASEDLSSARLRWDAWDLDDYRLATTQLHETSIERMVAVVRNGTVEAFEAQCGQEDALEPCEATHPEVATVAGAFAYIAEVIEAGGTLLATYDVVTGQPRAFGDGSADPIEVFEAGPAEHLD